MRWPSQISITGDMEQIAHFLIHGIYEAGCDDLLIPSDEESEVNANAALDQWRRMRDSKAIRKNGEIFQ